MNHFNICQRRRILNKLKSRRIVKNKYQLSILPNEYIYIETKRNNSYSYRIKVSSEKTTTLYLKLLKLFPYYSTVIIKRISKDINRDFDIMKSTNISLNKIKNIFKKYNELWTKCEFVAFGIIDKLTEFEVFINLNKEIVINTKYINIKKINSILNFYNLFNNISFISDYKYWSCFLPSIVSNDDIYKKNIFDYYKITNHIKYIYGFSIANLYDKIKLNTIPKWWKVKVKCLYNKYNKINFYIVASSIEEMETLIDKKMLYLNVDNYYIYDFYNVDPNNCNYEKFNIEHNDISFQNFQSGIWAMSNVFM